MSDKDNKPSQQFVSPNAGQVFEGVPAETLMKAYEHFLAMVAKLPAEQVIRCRFDVQAAVFNYGRGLDAILPFAARLRKEVPGISLDAVVEGRDLGYGLIFAAGRVVPEPDSDSHEVAAKLQRLRELRDPALDTAEILAKRKLLPAARVAAVRAGTGNYDTARDGVDLHGLYTEFGPSIAGKHSFSPAEIEELGELGSWLVARLTPPGTTRPAAPASTDADDVRNRFWTVFQQRGTDLRKLGYYLFGEEFNDHTPPLLSKRQRRKAAT